MIFLFLVSFSFAQNSIPAPVSQNPPIEIPLGKAPHLKNKRKVKGPVVLDARPFFKFSLNHIQDSQPIRFEDYSQSEDPFKGLIEPDVQLISRKLSALGISPQTEVIVLGEGSNGQGEEGRIAWLLNYMGIKKVRVMSYASYISKNPARRGSQTWYQNQAATVWLPKLNSNVRIRKNELKENLKKFNIIDCGSQQEFEKGHLPGAIRIAWTEFLDSEGNPKKAEDIKKVLTENKIDLKKDMVFYGHPHVGCGYPVFIINDEGLTQTGNARHYDGAYDDWKNN